MPPPPLRSDALTNRVTGRRPQQWEGVRGLVLGPRLRHEGADPIIFPRRLVFNFPHVTAEIEQFGGGLAC